MLSWVEIVRPNLEENTYAGYRGIIEKRIAPYFRSKKTTSSAGVVDHSQLIRILFHIVVDMVFAERCPRLGKQIIAGQRRPLRLQEDDEGDNVAER